MSETMISGAVMLGVAAMMCFAASRAWRGWLDLKRLELERQSGSNEPDELGLRIEVASVKERLRRLESLADGVDL